MRPAPAGHRVQANFSRKKDVFKPMKISLKFSFFTLIALLCFSAVSYAQVPAFDQNRAFAYLEKQCEFGYRHPGTEGHAACLNFLVETFKKTGARVQKQPFSHWDPFNKRSVTATNVIASFGAQRDRIILCAHWDTRPVADHDPNPANRNKPVPGANDGASGVAVLLEIANILAKNPPPIGIDLVLFDAEDSGTDGTTGSWCKGSAHFAQNLPVPFPRYAILIDMIGDRDLEIKEEGYSKQYAPQLVDMVWSKAESLGLPAFKRGVIGYVVDDHLELLKVGIPAIDLIDFEYPYWHTIEDTPDKCSAESLNQVGKLLVHLIYE